MIRTLFLLFLLLFSSASAENYLFFSHTYHLNEPNNVDKRDIFLDKLSKIIRNNSVDSVFVLGDFIDFADKNAFEYINKLYKKRLGQVNLYFAYGNHDGPFSNFKQIFGDSNQIIEQPNFRAVILNSSLEIDQLKKFIQFNFNFFLNDFYILTHHHICDDTMMSKKPFEQYKSFSLKELMSLFPDTKNIKMIITGDSNRKYFGFDDRNTNNVFYLDMVDNIKCLSIGMGNGIPKATGIILKNINNNSIIEPWAITYE